MGKPQKHYTKWKKPATKEHMLYDSIYMECAEKGNLWRQKTNWWLFEAGRWEGGLSVKEVQGIL